MLDPKLVAVVDPAKSRRMFAPWTRGSTEEEARAYLQARLTTLFKLMFWVFVALMAFLFIGYERYPQSRPHAQDWVYAAFCVGLAIQAALWRLVLLRRELSFEQLHAIDAFFVIGSNAIIAFCAVVSRDQRQAAYTCLIYACWTVLTRALIVPSTGKRTAVLTTIAMVPIAVSVVYLSFYKAWSAPGQKDLHAGAMILGYAQIAVVVVLLSASGSRIIYGLKQKADAVQQLGKYTLGRLLGEGGNGKVYLAHHLLLRRPTAIKLIPADKVGDDSIVRFEREVWHMSQLTHPNSVAVFDYGHAAGTFYYAMEYLGGGLNLQTLVTRHGKQPAERVRQILNQVCQALQEAHDLGLIHRDIKPANIILCERGAVPDVAKVLDYGLVKEITAESGASTQIVLGTPAYIAPEAVTDPSTIGPGADLYAVGAVGYFLLSGHRLFTGNSDLDVCIQHVTKPPRPLAELGVTVPPALEAVLMRCLAKRPADRFPSAQALADALAALGSLGDWDEHRALAWWQSHRPQEIPDDATSQPTVTLSIDVGARDEEAAA